MNEESNFISKEGYDNLKKELVFLKTEIRKKIAEKLEYASSLGDLSENSEHQSAKEEQAMNEARISYLENLLANVVIASKQSNGIVCVGSEVKLMKENGSKKEETYQIVGSEEADPVNRKISNNSPLGKSIINKKVGDTALVSTPQGVAKYVILGIN